MDKAELFWFKRRKLFGGVVFGILTQSIWVTRSGFEITLTKPTLKSITRWWKKIVVTFYPFSIGVVDNRY